LIVLDSDLTKLISLTPTTIHNEKKWEITIYPNPSSGLLNVDIPSNPEKNIKIDVMSSQGKLLIQKQFSDNEIALDLSVFTNGIYFIILQTGNERIYKKVLLIK